MSAITSQTYQNGDLSVCDSVPRSSYVSVRLSLVLIARRHLIHFGKVLAIFACFAALISPRSVQAVAIEPSAKDAAVDAGGEATTTFVVTNDQDRAITFHFDSVAASFVGDNEAPQFSNISPELSGWLDINPAIATIQPGQAQQVIITIAPPASMTDRTVIFGLRAVGDEVDGGAVKVREGVIGLVFLSIGSGGEASGKLVDYRLADRKFWQSRATVYSTITNTGSTVLKPSGTITIQNVQGKNIDVLELNPDGKRIAPGQTRTFSTNWKSGRAVGIYWAGLQLDSSSAVNGADAVTFYVFPWWSMVGGPIILVLVLIVARNFWRKKA